MGKYSLASAAISPRATRHQAYAVYQLLQPYNSVHTLEQLVRKAEETNYKALFNGRGNPTIEDSLKYHLHRFKKQGLVHVSED
jgi:hypothetical protein